MEADFQCPRLSNSLEHPDILNRPQTLHVFLQSRALRGLKKDMQLGPAFYKLGREERVQRVVRLAIAGGLPKVEKEALRAKRSQLR